MGSEEKPKKKPEKPRNATAGGYVPPPLTSAAQRHSPSAYVPPSISHPSQYSPPAYSPPQYVPQVGTPSDATGIDPMAPVGSVASQPIYSPPMTPTVAPTNQLHGDHSEYLPAMQPYSSTAEPGARTVFVRRQSNPILGFIIAGVIGMMGIVIVGLVVALAKKDDSQDTLTAMNNVQKKPAEVKTAAPNPASPVAPATTDVLIEPPANPSAKNQDQLPNKQVEPPLMKQDQGPRRMDRNKFPNDRPNRPKGMGNKNRQRPLPDEPKKEMPKNEPENKTVVPPAPIVPAPTPMPEKPLVVATQDNQKATPEQEIEFYNALKSVRTALEKRDFDTAKKEQQRADQLAITDDMKTMAEGMEMISQYNVIFWKFVQDAMRNLNGEIEIGSQVAFVITSNSETMSVRMQGKNREFTFNTLPKGLAVAIAKKVMNEDAANKATLGSFYFAHPQMGKLADAKELLSAAKKGGVRTAPALFLIEKEHLIAPK